MIPLQSLSWQRESSAQEGKPSSTWDIDVWLKRWTRTNEHLRTDRVIFFGKEWMIALNVVIIIRRNFWRGRVGPWLPLHRPQHVIGSDDFDTLTCWMQNSFVLPRWRRLWIQGGNWILVLTETDHSVLLIVKYWLQAAILVMSFGETTVRQLLCERSHETLVLAAFVRIQWFRVAIAHAKSAVLVSTGMKQHGRSFNDNPKWEEREKRCFTSDFANQMEILGWWSLLLVLSLRDPVFVWMLSGSWLLILIRECVEACGSLVPMWTRSSIPKFLRENSLNEEERRNICRHKSSFTGLISVYREDGVCCVFHLVAQSCLGSDWLLRSTSVLWMFFSTEKTEFASLVHLECDYLGSVHWWFWDRTSSSAISWESFSFCSCCGHPATYCLSLPERPFWWNLSVYERVRRCVWRSCLTVRCLSLLHFLQSSRVFKHLLGVNAFVFFLACKLKADPSCVPLGKMLDIDDLDPARLPQRKSKSDYVELVSRSRERWWCVGWS